MIDTGYHPANQPNLIPAEKAATRYVDVHPHGLGAPRMMAAFNAITARLGRDRARLFLCIKNPAWVLRSEECVTVETWTQQEVS